MTTNVQLQQTEESIAGIASAPDYSKTYTTEAKVLNLNLMNIPTQLAERLRCYISTSCKKVRNNLATSQTPTDVEIAQFLHGFVGGLNSILDRAEAFLCSSESSSSLDKDVIMDKGPLDMVSITSVRRQIAKPFDGLYDFDRNQMLVSKRAATSLSVMKQERPGKKRCVRANAEGYNKELSSMKSVTSNTNNLTPKDVSCTKTSENDSNSEGDEEDDDDNDEDDDQNEEAQRLTLQHMVYILNALENLFCVGNQVLRRLAAEDLHTAIRKRIGEKKFSAKLLKHSKSENTDHEKMIWRSNTTTLPRTYADVSSLSSQKNIQSAKTSFLEDVYSTMVKFEIELYPDHHVVFWSFHLAGENHTGKCLFFCEGFNYARHD